MKISVVIPFYNLERYARPCLDSVVAAFRQRAVGLEVVVVDDGSTDGTPLVLDDYASLVAGRLESDAFAFRVIHQSNGGEGAARNAGMAAATGDWITFLDGDDVWLANQLEVAVPLLERYSDVDIVALKYASFDDGEDLPSPSGGGSTAKRFDLRHEIPSEVLLEVGVFPTFFRRASVDKTLFSSLPLGADRLFVAQCLALAGEVVKCDAVVHGYRVRDGSMARAVWNGRKVCSQCDYAFGSLQALADSGKRLGRTGQIYLASLWLSDVPNRLRRISSAERCEAVEHWIKTLAAPSPVSNLHVYESARLILRAAGGVSTSFVLRLAWLFRKGGLI